MVIAPLDHLWVWVNVYELDQDKVQVGQTMEIQFPFLDQKIQGKRRVRRQRGHRRTPAPSRSAPRSPTPAPGSRPTCSSRRSSTSRPCRARPSSPGIAMVVDQRRRLRLRPQARGDPNARPSDPDQFERRKIEVAQENRRRGRRPQRPRKPGEEVVTNGSLILAQLYEDQRIVDTGLPAAMTRPSSRGPAAIRAGSPTERFDPTRSRGVRSA